MSTINNIYKFIDYKQISVNEFSKKIEVSNGYFAKQKSSNGSISSNIIEKIVIEYPEINTEWLLTGKGEMLKSANTPTHETSSDIQDEAENNVIQELIMLHKEHINDKNRIILTLEEKIKTLLDAKKK